MANGPLRDVRILDLTHVWAGPLATRILADLGAQVLKVEAPMSRGPRTYPGKPIAGFVGGHGGEEPYNKNAAFVKLQRNKKSIGLDLKSDQGRTVFLDLVEVADVVIENFSARAMSALDLDYTVLQKRNPRIIHVAMPGFGLSGPYKDWVAFGPTVEPMSGLTHVMGYSCAEPRSTAMALPDPIAAAHSVCAVLTALRNRDATGKGSLVEMSLHESAVSANGAWLVDHQLGAELTRLGNAHPSMVPHGIYRCVGEDQWVAIACRDDADWIAMCGCINTLDDELAVHERRKKRVEIDRQITRWTSVRDHNDVESLLQQKCVPVGHVRRTPDMVADKQVQARGFFVPLDQGTPMPGNPIKMDGISNQDWTPCPPLGNNNREVLSSWLDMSDEEIETLYEQQVVFDRPPN
ncbi:MAG: CoA transferase [Gammaproteobacteria bacterium]|nr:CoA transferase [Gammaproteobacteria bacterium]